MKRNLTSEHPLAKKHGDETSAIGLFSWRPSSIEWDLLGDECHQKDMENRHGRMTRLGIGVSHLVTCQFIRVKKWPASSPTPNDHMGVSKHDNSNMV